MCVPYVMKTVGIESYNLQAKFEKMSTNPKKKKHRHEVRTFV